MAIQITRRAIIDAAINVDKMDLSSGTFNFQSAVLQVATPSADSHAASKGYVDSIAQGLQWKESVRVATTANITLSGTQTIDGVSVVADDRVLVKNQTDATQNGIYLCKAGSWERAADMNAGSEFSGSAVFVQEGTSFADTGFVCSNNGDITVGSDNVAFVQFTGAGQFTAGDGLTLTGSTFSVNVDDSSLEINGDALRVKAAGVTNAMLAGSIENAKLQNSTISGISLGSNLNSLSASASGAISLTSYNGSAAVTDLAVNVDDLTIGISSNNLYIKDGAIGSAKLGLSSVTTDKVNDGAITTAKIQDSAIATAKLADGAVTTAKLAADCVDQSKIADGAVRREHLNSNVVNAAGAIGLDLTNNDLLVITDDSTIEITGNNDIAVKDSGISTAKIADSAVTAIKLAGSIPADKLNLGNGVQESAGNLTLTLDGSSLAVSGSGLKVADAGISTAKIADSAVTLAKVAFAGQFEKFTANGSTAAFDLAVAIDTDFAPFFVVSVNGLIMEYAATPSGKDQYKIDNTGAGSVGKITFGANLDNNDQVMIRYLA